MRRQWRRCCASTRLFLVVGAFLCRASGYVEDLVAVMADVRNEAVTAFRQDTNVVAPTGGAIRQFSHDSAVL
jgi:hypothetical protein